MGMGRYVVDAVLLEGRSARELARAHGISKSWIYGLIGRYRAGGYEALEPRSRRPRSCSHETPPGMVREIAKLRGELEALGHDAGAEGWVRSELPLEHLRCFSDSHASRTRRPT